MCSPLPLQLLIRLEQKQCQSGLSFQIFREYQRFIYSPTDAPVRCLKGNIKIYNKIYIKTAPTCFGVTVTPPSVYCRTVQRTDTNKDPKYAATPPPY